MERIKAIRKAIASRRARSAWDRGVTAYALDLIEDIEERAECEKHEPATPFELEDYALNGARNWLQYSRGGSALIYNEDIAKRLCTPGEYKRTREGKRKPNAQEDWLDVQARALNQAYYCILQAWRTCMKEEG